MKTTNCDGKWCAECKDKVCKKPKGNQSFDDKIKMFLGKEKDGADEL